MRAPPLVQVGVEGVACAHPQAVGDLRQGRRRFLPQFGRQCHFAEVRLGPAL